MIEEGERVELIKQDIGVADVVRKSMGTVVEVMYSPILQKQLMFRVKFDTHDTPLWVKRSEIRRMK
jgi:hypothetical protein